MIICLQRFCLDKKDFDDLMKMNIPASDNQPAGVDEHTATGRDHPLAIYVQYELS